MVKGKVIPVLNKVARHEDVWVTVVLFHAFLMSVLEGSEWSGSSTDHFTSVGIAPNKQWTKQRGPQRGSGKGSDVKIFLHLSSWPSSP